MTINLRDAIESLDGVLVRLTASFTKSLIRFFGSYGEPKFVFSKLELVNEKAREEVPLEEEELDEASNVDRPMFDLPLERRN